MAAAEASIPAAMAREPRSERLTTTRTSAPMAAANDPRASTVRSRVHQRKPSGSSALLDRRARAQKRRIGVGFEPGQPVSGDQPGKAFEQQDPSVLRQQAGSRLQENCSL